MKTISIETRSHCNTDSSDINKLAAGIRSGRIRDFETVFRLLFPGLHAFIFKYCLDHDRASDLVQEAFFKLWQSRSSIRPEMGVKSLLFTIVLNLWRDSCRKQSIPEYPIHEMDSFSSPDTTDSPPSDPQTLKKVRAVLATLSDDDRAMLFLVKTGGLTYQEAADVFAVNEKTVRRRITRFVDVLASELGETPIKKGGMSIWLLIA